MDAYVAGLMPSADVALALEFTIPQVIPEDCPCNCWNCKTIRPDKPFEAPEASHTAPFSPGKHNHLPTQHCGIYHVMWANLEIWQDVLRRLSFDPTEPLDTSAWPVETFVEMLVEAARIQKIPMENHFVSDFASNFAKRFAT